MQQTYQMPPQALVDLVDAPYTPSVKTGPNQEWLLIIESRSLPSVEELAQPELRLAGLRFNPQTNASGRKWYYSALKLKKISSGDVLPISGLPENARMTNIRWSPDGKHISFIATETAGQSLWIAGVENRQAKKLVDSGLNTIYGTAYRWLAGSEALICKVVPEDRGAAPEKSLVPAGPVIQESSGRKAPARTYQDLLQNNYDKDLFEYYLDAQILHVGLDGEQKIIGSNGMIRKAEPSPDGRFLLVEKIHRPFSYLVPVSRFPHTVEIWHMDGSAAASLADIPLAEEIPIGFGAVRTGPRNYAWRADAPATVYWTEAQDGGDPRQEADVRDQIYTLPAPFSGSPQPLAALGMRYYKVQWSSDELALAYEWWWKNRTFRIWRIRPGANDAAPELLFDYSWQDRYNDPGSPLMKMTPAGKSVLVTSADGKSIFLAGDGASPEGDRPFLDQFNLNEKESNRLWRSEAPYYEKSVKILDQEKQVLLTRRESKTEPPNYFLRKIGEEELTQVTDFQHPTPQLKNVQKEQIRYDREDGVRLTGTLYLPAGYKAEDGALPTLLWAYPQEYKSADAAGQVSDSPYRFVRVGWWSPVIWVAMGYAVLDDPTMPIIGEGDDEPNDTYVPQLVSSAKAAVDELKKRGVAEDGRIAIAGHSYGAFMAANLLAHSDIFAAGIARSGAYNRSLTPFGFQAEERTFWEAPEVYFQMSPFMHAEKVNEPILLIHGEVDNNSGTFPIQSKRFYHAIKGLGGTARLVMLPNESHGYRARESVMHMFWEMNHWLDKYVSNAVQAGAIEEGEPSSME